MFNTKKFKVYKAHSIFLTKLNNLEKKGYSEIPSEPTAGDIYLYSLTKKIFFPQCLELIRTSRKINILVAMSMIYYYYCEDLYFYILQCKVREKRYIRKKCLATLRRWKNLMKMSDDLLYPQNKYIKSILIELKV